jgi:CheY-like chemotaxis protein
LDTQQKKQNLLIVDDDAAHLLTISRALRQFPQLQLLTAKTIAEAKPLLEQQEAPILCLVDLRLNNESGLELLGWIRSQSRLASVPVLVLSTSQNPKDFEASMAAGATNYLVKNSDLSQFQQDLAATVSGFLGR